jgi:hypothetical protein
MIDKGVEAEAEPGCQNPPIFRSVGSTGRRHPHGVAPVGLYDQAARDFFP